MRLRRLVLAGLGISPLYPMNAQALNYHELEVYPYATAAKGEFELENAFVYTDQGSRDVPAPDNNQGTRRTSFEASYGVTDKTEVAGYADLTRAPNGEWRHAGDRIRARTRFFEKGELPVDLGLYAEAEFPQHEANDFEFELRGILETDFGKWTLDVNPMLEKTVKGIEASDGWELQYAAGLIYRANEWVHPRLDVFGDMGPVHAFDPREEQKHLVSPAVDVRLTRSLKLTAGVGFGLTDATEHRLLRTRLEWEFY